MTVSTAPTALLLAGGLGTRLRSVTGATPKVLAPINGRPFIELLLTQLARSGVRDVVLCTGYGADLIEAACGDGARFGLRLRYSREPEALGTGGALKLAEPLLETETFLALNADSLIATDLSALWRFHAEKQAALSLLLAQVPDRSRYGAVTLDGAGRVVGFGEKAQSGPGYISAGVYVAQRELLAAVPTGRAVSFETEVAAKRVGNGLYGLPTDAPFIDIGTPDSYGQLEAFLRDHWPR